MFHLSSSWLRSFNIKPASEAKQRKAIKEIETAIIKGISAPFTFASKDEPGTFEIGSAGWAFMENFKEHLFSRIYSLMK